MTKKSRWDSSDEEESDDGRSKKRPSAEVSLVDDPSRGRNKSPIATNVTSVTAADTLNTDKLASTHEGMMGKEVESEYNTSTGRGAENPNQSRQKEMIESNSEDSVAAFQHDEEMDDSRVDNTGASTTESSYNPLFYGCRSVDEYQRVNFIDQGTYGMVYRAKCRKTGVVYALKQVKLSGPEISKVGFPITALRETNILLDLHHPNIIKIKEMVVGATLDKVFMVMEFCDYDLKKCIEMAKPKPPFSTAEVKQLMTKLLSAVEHIHSKWYLHRDLKTSNLLYSNKGILQVCDFGLARKYGDPIMPYTAEVVTLWYRPPELLLGSKTYSTALDIWSVGCIFSELLNGQPLFSGEGELDQISKIFKMLGLPTEERWPGYSSLPNVSKISWRAPSKGKLRDLYPTTSFSGGVYLNETGFDLLSKLLHMDPSQRISAADALKHPWLASEEPRPTPLSYMPIFSNT